MRRLLEGITNLTRRFIRNPMLLFGLMALIALFKLLTAPGNDPE